MSYYLLLKSALMALKKSQCVCEIHWCKQKAFDTVCHKTLLFKLRKYLCFWYYSCQLNLIESYLSNRVQCVWYNNQLLTYFSSSKYGVPRQGSMPCISSYIYISMTYLTLFMRMLVFITIYMLTMYALVYLKNCNIMWVESCVKNWISTLLPYYRITGAIPTN